MAAAQAGDSDAFVSLLNQYSRHTYRLGLSITGSHQDAEDVLQESSRFAALDDRARKDCLASGRTFDDFLNAHARPILVDTPGSNSLDSERDIEAIGLPREYLVRLHRRGKHNRRGIYTVQTPT